MRGDVLKAIKGSKDVTNAIILTHNIDFIFLQSMVIPALQKCGQPALTVFTDAECATQSFIHQRHVLRGPEGDPKYQHEVQGNHKPVESVEQTHDVSPIVSQRKKRDCPSVDCPLFPTHAIVPLSSQKKPKHQPLAGRMP